MHPRRAALARQARGCSRRRGAGRAAPPVAAMKVAVVGAGIVGVTTAYELAALGHEVLAY